MAKFYHNLLFYIKKKLFKKVAFRVFCIYAFFLLFATIFLSFGWTRNSGVGAFDLDGLINSFFTVISAFTTTGLIVLDIEQEFNFGGQLIIMFLIFFGAIGLLFIKVHVFLFLRFLFFGNKKISLSEVYEQHFERGHFSTTHTVKMLKVGFFVIFILEIVGAIAIFFYLLFNPIANTSYYHDWTSSLWAAIFLSVSATSNAGFDVIADGEGFNSLAVFASHYFLLIVIILQFLLGGLGFPIYLELWERFNPSFLTKKKFTFFARLIFWFYIFAIIISLTVVFLFEIILDVDAQKDGNWAMKIIFNTLSARSSGFSTVNIKEQFTAPSVYTFSLLMWIGCSPLSTGGGIKVTTFMFALFALFLRKDARGNFLFGKTAISSDSVTLAYKIVFFSLVLIFITSIAGITEIKSNSNETQSLSLFDSIFHATSSLGNAGLTTIKMKIKGWYFFKILSIILMLVGQIGIINLISHKKRDFSFQSYSLPKKLLF